MTSSPAALEAGVMAQEVTEIFLEAIPIARQLAITMHGSDSDIS